MSCNGVITGRVTRIVLLALSLFAACDSAHAAIPAALSTQQVELQLPAKDSNAVVNLRSAGAIFGSPILAVDNVSLKINGVEGRRDLDIQAYGTQSDTTGQVCVIIANNGYVPNPNDVLTLHVRVMSYAVGSSIEGDIPITLGSVGDSSNCEDVGSAPIARVNVPSVINDTDNAPGESVALDASGSSDADPGTKLTYKWYRVIDTAIEANPFMTTTQPVARVALDDGAHELALIAMDDSLGANGLESEAVYFTVTVNGPGALTANGGADRTVNDTDGKAGEQVALDASATTGQRYYYEWREGDGLLASGFFGATPPVADVDLADGVHVLTLLVNNLQGEQSTDTVTITVAAPTAPTANAGTDITKPDTNGAPGEAVDLSGTANPFNGTIESYGWYLVENGQEQALASTANASVSLADGTHIVRFRVTTTAGLSAQDDVQIVVTPPAAPNVVITGARAWNDTDGKAGESVTLDGSTSTTSFGSITNYNWFLVQNGQEQSLGSGARATFPLADGQNTVRLRITTSTGISAATDTQIAVAAPSQMIANAGADFSVKDSDAQPGEYVDLNGSASGGPPNSQPTYQWTLGDSVLGSSATLTHVRLPDGNNTVTLTVTFDSELSTSDTVQITVGNVQMPVANAGPDETITDTDDVPGKTITLDASNSSTPIGTITAYEWAQIDGQVTRPLGTGPTVTFDAQPGSTRVRLTITNSFGQVATAEKIVTLTEPMGPTANAGPDRVVHDTDHQAGEPIALDGSASNTASGTITSYEWSLVTQEGTQPLGSGAKLTTSLPNGVNTVQLVVTNSNAMSASDTVQITVMAMSTRTQLAELPNLTPNQRKMAAALDDLCSRVVDDNGAAIDTGTSSSKRVKVSQSDRDDLVNRCRGLVFSNSAANQVEALRQLGADDFAAARTQATLFSTYQYTGVMDRLAALRGGAHGVSIAGLNLSIDGDVVPLAQMRSMVRHFLGGGASSDADSAADEPGGLLGDKLGLWFRGNYSFGKKDADISSPRFDADQWVMLAGVDYRLSDHAVLGTAFSYANSRIKFDPTDPGGLDTKAWTASVYGSFYTAKSFYLDLTANVTNSNYDADRNITYVDGSGLVQADARGSTGGLTYSGGFSGGYDFVHGGLTISPNVGAFYINATIDSFTETGAGGLNLLYDDQNFRSLTGTAGLRMSYAWKQTWGVLLPHLRADFVQEFADATDVFAVRFAADPDVDNAPPILVETKNPDNSYWRLAGGFSFQLAHGLSGYLEYQRLQSFQSLAFSDVSGGVRFQRSF